MEKVFSALIILAVSGCALGVDNTKLPAVQKTEKAGHETAHVKVYYTMEDPPGFEEGWDNYAAYILDVIQDMWTERNFPGMVHVRQCFQHIQIYVVQDYWFDVHFPRYDGYTPYGRTIDGVGFVLRESFWATNHTAGLVVHEALHVAQSCAGYYDNEEYGHYAHPDFEDYVIWGPDGFEQEVIERVEATSAEYMCSYLFCTGTR